MSKHHVAAIITKLIKKIAFEGAAASFKGCSRDDGDGTPIAPQLVVLVSSGGSNRINSARLLEAELSDRLECSYKRLTSGFSKQAQRGQNTGGSMRREDAVEVKDAEDSDFTENLQIIEKMLTDFHRFILNFYLKFK